MITKTLPTDEDTSTNPDSPNIHDDVASNNEHNDSNSEEKKEIDHVLEENKDKAKAEGKTNDKHSWDEDLETQASKKYYLPGYSKGSHHRCRFTSTWVQYSDGLGYAYGGADPLNYDPTTKNRFIRRVFTIVLIMLLVTSVYNFCSAKMDLRSFYEEDGCLLVVVSVAVVMVALNCFTALSECTRSPPATYICLFLTLICACIVSGFFSGRYNTLLITYAYVTTAFVAIAFIIIANTSYDFTHWSLHIIGVSVALPFISAFFMIAYFRAIEHVRSAYPLYVLIIMIVGTLINILIMTVMLQIILGSQAVEILEDDYTLGAFYLYTSIFDIYIKMVQLTGIFGGNDEE